MTTQTIDPTQYTAHQHPGKFEGETAATEYFYKQSLNGDGETLWYDATEEEDQPISGILFHIQSDEADAFNLPIGHYFLLREDSQGYAYGSVHATRSVAEEKFNSWIS